MSAGQRAGGQGGHRGRGAGGQGGRGARGAGTVGGTLIRCRITALG